MLILLAKAYQNNLENIYLFYSAILK